MLFSRKKITLSQRIEEVGGASSGFDYMRIGLAVSVILWHSIVTTHGQDFERPFWGEWRVVIGGILPMFFALSGFLVAGSLIRTSSIGTFLSLRAIRLYPALAVEVLLSALILGPLLTTVPLSEYFSSRMFWAYFHNILGYVTYPLPGLFVNNPIASVTNISLWTLPYELECYICLTIVATLGLLKRRQLLLAGLIFLIVVVTFKFAFIGGARQFAAPPGRLLVTCFLGGVLTYCYRDRIPYSSGVFVVALLLQLVLSWHAATAYVAVLPTVYVTVYLGLLNPPKRTFLMRGDYSYGLYLFACPIQQAYAQLFPQHRVFWLSTVFTLCVGIAYAAFSWHVIEKPILRRRSEIIQGLRITLRPVTRVVSFGFRNERVRR